MSHDDKIREDKTRRDFIFVATGAVATGGLTAASWPIMAQMGMATDVKWPTYDVDVSTLEEGQELRVTWMGRPIFIRHRTRDEIQTVENIDLSLLIDPEADKDRLKTLPDGTLNKRFLVIVGLCTHFGCVPVADAGDFNGWYCPCHSSHFDMSGRTRKGPAPRNMTVPPYEWLSETRLTLKAKNEK